MKSKKIIAYTAALLSLSPIAKISLQTSDAYCSNYDTEIIQSERAGASYAVSNLTESTDVTASYASHYDKYAIDLDDNTLYYVVDQIIYKVDITTGKSEVFLDFTGSSSFKLYNHLMYNQFDKNVYCFANRNNKNIIFNLSNQKYYECRNANFFIAQDKVIYLHKSSGNSVNDITEIDLNSGKDISSGYIRSLWYYNYKPIPFLHDESYYWLDFGGPKGQKPHIVYSNKLSWDVNSKYVGEYIGDFDGIAGTVYNDTVYIMKEDFSIYKLNIEKLWEVHEILSDPDNPLNNTLTGEPAVSYEDALEIYINGNEIKQTGTNNINTVSDFKITSDGSVVIYDGYDKKYKLIKSTEQNTKINYGDADCDGNVKLNDAVLIMQSIGNPDSYGVNGTDMTHITEQGVINADVYNTGDKLTNMDALSIQRYLINLIPELPVIE